MRNLSVTAGIYLNSQDSVVLLRGAIDAMINEFSLILWWSFLEAGIPVGWLLLLQQVHRLGPVMQYCHDYCDIFWRSFLSLQNFPVRSCFWQCGVHLFPFVLLAWRLFQPASTGSVLDRTESLAFEINRYSWDKVLQLMRSTGLWCVRRRIL